LRASMVDAQGALLSVVVLDAAVAGLVLGGFWLAVTLMKMAGRKIGYSLTPLGFSRPRGGILVGVGLGVAVGIGAVFVSLLVNPLSVLVLERLGYPTESTVQQPFMRGLVGWVRESPGLAVPAIILVVVLFGPAVEELVFRGAVFNGLYRLTTLLFSRPAEQEDYAGTARKASFAVSALASSVLFALLHLEPVLLPALLILAFILCALFQRTQSLLPPFVAHATFNSFAASLIILSGLGVFEMPL